MTTVVDSVFVNLCAIGLDIVDLLPVLCGVGVDYKWFGLWTLMWPHCLLLNVSCASYTSD